MATYKVKIKGEDKTGSAFRSVNKNAKNTTSALMSAKGAMAGFIGVAGGVKLLSFAKDSIEFADAISKTADKLGLATDTLQEYRFVASQTGVEQGTLEKGIQNMVRGIADFSRGTGEAKIALEKLNIEASDLKDLSPEEQFELIADKLKNVTNNTDKLSMAYQLFGGRATSLINTINLGAGGINKLQQEFRDAGGVMDEALIGKAVVINDMWDKLTKTVGTKFKSAMIEAAAGVIDFGNAWEDEFRSIGSSFNKLVNGDISIEDFVMRGSSGALSKLGQVKSELDLAVEANAAAKAKLDSQKDGTQETQETQPGLTDEQIQLIVQRDTLAFQLQAQNKQEADDLKFSKEMEQEEKTLQLKLDAVRETEAAEEKTLQLKFDAMRKLKTAEDKDRKDKIKADQAANRLKVSAVSQTFGALSTLMQSNSRRLFEIGKKASIAGALVNAYESITATMKRYPYPYNVPLAAAQGVAAMAQVQRIRQTKFGGGGGGSVSVGGGGAGSYTPTNNLQTNPLQVDTNGQQLKGGSMTINIYNPELLSSESIDLLVDNISDKIENRDVILISKESRNGQELSLA